MREKIRNIIATSIYLNPTGGFNGYDDATDKIMTLILNHGEEEVLIDKPACDKGYYDIRAGKCQYGDVSPHGKVYCTNPNCTSKD